MRLADAVDDCVRTWDAHERARGARPIVDFDCTPPDQPPAPATNRLEVYDRLTDLHAAAGNDPELAAVTRAHLTYLEAVLGHRRPLEEYVTLTQGCPVAGWPEDHVMAVADTARQALAAVGIDWGPDTDTEARAAESPLDIHQARAFLPHVARSLEPAVRTLTGTNASYTLTIETTEIDDYWSYWLDGAGHDVRLRLNTRHATFTEVRLRQFAAHEILGHALQYTTYTHHGEHGHPPTVNVLGTHLPYQVMFEGLACTLPLFLPDTDPHLTARVRLDHYLQLVYSELHQAINTGATVADCVTHARARVPWWTSDTIADALSDPSNDPLLRSYLWAYPAGMDWFVALADTADPPTQQEVLRAAYQQPLTPTDLTALWPAGPHPGGPGAPVRLRKPALP
jgi:hypothetical protein